MDKIAQNVIIIFKGIIHRQTGRNCELQKDKCYLHTTRCTKISVWLLQLEDSLYGLLPIFV